MSSVTTLITVLALATTILAVPKSHEKADKIHPKCQDFTQGLTFNDSQAVGTWHLMHLRTGKINYTEDLHCVQFSFVSEQERRDLKALIEKYLENLKWDSLTLKMQIPCVGSNKIRDYYLERLEDDGSYRTLQMPPPTAKLDLSDFHRYPMRLKIIEGQYLGMMDCHEKFVFILGKQPPSDKELDEKLKKIIEAYWPAEK